MRIHNYSQDIDALEKKRKKLMIEIFAKNIRELRQQKNLTQEEVSVMAGISAKYLQEVEAARKSPSARVVVQLAKALDCPICRILPSGNGCPNMNDNMRKEIKKLLAGREEKDIEKAIKILQILFS